MDNKFITSAVVDPVAGQRSFLQLYNPVGSGVEVHFPKWNLAWSGGEVGLVRSGYDIRESAGPWGAFYKFGRNKRFGKVLSKAMLYKGTFPAGYLPSNDGIVYEPWPNMVDGGMPKFFDRPPYELIPEEPFILEPGWGAMIAAAHDQTYLISTFEFSEHPFTETPPVSDPGPVPGNVGSVITSLVNGANAFDGNEATFANDNEGTTFHVGKLWSEEKTITDVCVKSLPGRSFSGANPGRVYSWTLQAFSGGAWVTHASGTYTEPGTGSTQSVLNLTSLNSTGFGHYIRMVDSAAASHKVSHVGFSQA